tara:strand:+ start:309 stop:566 length:258 start_codon:yes stop_codon:yes gene_type:complete
MKMSKITELTEKEPTLERLQEMVGGYIQLLELPDTGKQMIVNEEGLLLGLSYNEKATEIYYEENRHKASPILGDVVILSGSAKMK